VKPVQAGTLRSGPSKNDIRWIILVKYPTMCRTEECIVAIVCKFTDGEEISLHTRNVKNRIEIFILADLSCALADNRKRLASGGGHKRSRNSPNF
jgi:hypothetical protein